MKKERNIWRDREIYCKGNKVKREGRMTGRTLQIARHVEFRIKMASDDNFALFPRNKYPISLSRHKFIHSLSFCSTMIIVFSYTNSLYRVEDEIISKVIYSEKIVSLIFFFFLNEWIWSCWNHIIPLNWFNPLVFIQKNILSY